MLDLIHPPLFPCCVSSFHSEAATPQQRPLPTPLRKLCGTIHSAYRQSPPCLRHSGPSAGASFLDPAQLARSVPRLPLVAPSGKIASDPRIRAKSFVTLRTEPGFCGPRQSCSPLHGQNCSSLRSSQDCPFRPPLNLRCNATEYRRPQREATLIAPLSPFAIRVATRSPGRSLPAIPAGIPEDRETDRHCLQAITRLGVRQETCHTPSSKTLPKTPAATNRLGLLSGSHPPTAA